MKIIAAAVIVAGLVGFTAVGDQAFSSFTPFGQETCGPQKLVVSIDGENRTFTSKSAAQQELGIPDAKMDELEMRNGVVWINPECGKASEVG